jgi:UDP-2,3-diacylglucosamine hydrolase
LINGKKIYFVSDAHLGVPNRKSSLEREKKLVRFLDSIKDETSELYLLGDIFDFWFEYKHVIPRGYTRLFGKLAEISDSGIPIHYFTGNHDMWMFGYLTEELNIQLYKEPIEREINGKKFFIGHGDGLGPRDRGYKFIKKVFSNRFCQWLFARFHPNFGFWLANYFSKKSRIANGKTDEIFMGEDKEYLILFAKEILQKEHFDYFVFGHRHLPLEIKLNEKTMYFNLGDWVSRFTYGVFDGSKLELKSFEEQ